MSEVICIYGIGEGELYREYKSWLEEDKERLLVFIEDDAESFSRFLYTQHDPRARAYLITPDSEDEVYKQIAWDCLFLSFSYRAHPDKEKLKPKVVEHVFAKMAFFQSSVQLFASEYSDFGARVLTNVRKNSTYLPEAYAGSSLFGAFSGIPALICGGGPSLDKHRELLRELSDRALLFAGGSALRVLSTYHITPHFGAGIDPTRPTADPLSIQPPFFYQERLSPEILSLVEGPLLWMPGSGNHLIEQWLGEQLSLDSPPLDVGWTVGNFCAKLALEMGCNPIIFVGMDFSAEKGKLYASEIEPGNEPLIWVQGVDGKKFYAKRAWVMAAQWMEKLAEENQETHFINATEGGLGFRGIEALSLQKISRDYLERSYDLQAMVDVQIASLKPLAVSKEQIALSWAHIDSSVERCKKQCHQLLEIAQISYPDSPLDKGAFILHQFDLQEELVYQKLLEPVWKVWHPFFKRREPEIFTDKVAEEINKILFYLKVLNG